MPQMILEGLVTTCGKSDTMHVAAMGPQVLEQAIHSGVIESLVLRPFASSQTARNLARVPAGVFHLSDDVLLLAQIVTATLTSPPACQPATLVPGWVLENVCHSYEFTIESADTSLPRTRLLARVVAEHEGRPFIGFNRARHAVVEGSILVTRLHMLGVDEVARRLQELFELVEKTGGSREHEAFALLKARVAQSASCSRGE